MNHLLNSQIQYLVHCPLRPHLIVLPCPLRPQCCPLNLSTSVWSLPNPNPGSETNVVCTKRTALLWEFWKNCSFAKIFIVQDEIIKKLFSCKIFWGPIHQYSVYPMLTPPESKDNCSLHKIDAKTSFCAGSNHSIYFKMLHNHLTILFFIFWGKKTKSE